MAIFSILDYSPTIDQSAYVAESATVIGQVTLEARTSVWPQAVIRGDNAPIFIGSGSNIQDGAVLHNDHGYPLYVGSQVTVGHQATLHGCTVGDGSLIGIRAVVLNGAVIGKNCLVGAGSLITEGKTYPDGVLIVGSPAKVMRTLTPEELASIKKNAEDYVEKGARSKEQLKHLE